MICHHLLYFIKQKFCLVRCWSFSIKSDCKVSTLSSRAFSSSETILSVWTQASCVTSTLSSTSSLGSSSEQSLLALVLMLEIDLLYFEGLWDFLGLLLQVNDHLLVQNVHYKCKCVCWYSDFPFLYYESTVLIMSFAWGKWNKGKIGFSSKIVWASRNTTEVHHTVVKNSLINV